MLPFQFVTSLQSFEARLFLLYRLAAALAAATAVVGGAVYSQTSGHKFNVAKIAEGFGNSLAALLSPDNFNAAVYSFLTAGLGLYSLILLFGSPEVVLAIAPCLTPLPHYIPKATTPPSSTPLFSTTLSSVASSYPPLWSVCSFATSCHLCQVH